MCKSLPLGALDFDLYSACPFESLPASKASVCTVTAPAVVPVGSPLSPSVLVACPYGADSCDDAQGRDASESFLISGMGLDAPMWLPGGSHTGPGVGDDPSLMRRYVVVMGHSRLRPGAYNSYF